MVLYFESECSVALQPRTVSAGGKHESNARKMSLSHVWKGVVTFEPDRKLLNEYIGPLRLPIDHAAVLSQCRRMGCREVKSCYRICLEKEFGARVRGTYLGK